MFSEGTLPVLISHPSDAPFHSKLLSFGWTFLEGLWQIS